MTDPDDLGYQASLPSRRTVLRGGLTLGVMVPFGTLWLAACSTDNSASPKGTSTARNTPLQVRSETDMKNLDPAFWTSKPDANIAECLLEGLVGFKPGTWDLVNTLAEEFERSKDGMSYRFTLKPGIPFHGDYGEVTAEDVKFSYERIAGITKPDIKAVYQADWAALKGVELDGKYGGTIVLKRPFTPLERTTLPVMSGKVVSKQAVKELGDKFSTHVIGTGPYRMGKWVPSQETVLERFDEYGGANKGYAPKAQWSQIVISPITEDNAVTNAFKTNAIDFGNVGLSYIDTVKSQSDLGVKRAPTTTYQFLSMNIKDPILSDIRVRQAIRLAIDTPGIISAAYDGRYDPAHAIVAPEMGIGYWSDAPHYERNVAQAKTLLQQAGKSNIKLRLSALNAQAERTASQVIQQNLADIGITVNLDIQDSARFYAIPGNGAGGPNRQLVFLDFVTEPDPYWAFVWWMKNQIGQWNLTNWTDPKFEKYFAEAAREKNTKRRTQLYIEMQKLWDKSASMVWIAYWVEYYGTKKSISETLRPDGSPLYWDITRKA